ncbi:hypothetical protein [Lentzea sp. NPDC059081]|uniref:hypothetical protein n=1 Tax=Lentzea sp. NPDC059081 TaxID=3346719 RepID=UPI00369486CA
MNTLWPALIAAVAALGGVTVGALVEPLKLSAARRARARQEHGERCARFVEAATSSRSGVIRLNVAHRRVKVGGEEVSADEILALETAYYTARNELRQVAGLIDLYGPDELAHQAFAVREADRQFRRKQWIVEDSGVLDRSDLPPGVRDYATAMENEIRKFTALARKSMS